MTFSIPSLHRNRGRNFTPLAPAFALAVSIACSSFAQETAPKVPQPAIPPIPADDSAMLPEGADKTPNPDAPILSDEPLPNPPPPGAIPVRGLQGMEPQNLPDGSEEDPSQLPPITEAPSSEEAVDRNWEIAREVAMNQALSTGDTLLGSLGGLGGFLSSPFLDGSPDSPVTSSGKPLLRPMRIGSFDVNMHASLGVIGNHFGGMLYADDYAVGGLFQGGFSALFGRDRLTTLLFSYDVAGNYPENSARGRQAGSEGGSGNFDQNISLVGSFTFPELRKVRFVFGVNYARLSGIDRDNGRNSQRQIATALFSASYQYSQKTSFKMDVSVPVRQFSDAVSSTGITGTLSGDTQITRKTSIGLGYTFGSLQVENGSDQIFHQALVRVKYSPTRFVLFDASAGVDFRDRGGSTTVAPIFGLGATWDSRHGTLVKVAAERRIFNAASAIDTNFTSTSIVLSATHRFDCGVMTSLSAGYEYSEYDSFGSGVRKSRTDKLSYVASGVMVPLALHWNCSLSCSAGKNESDVQEFDFVQTTFKTTLSF